MSQQEGRRSSHGESYNQLAGHSLISVSIEEPGTDRRRVLLERDLLVQASIGFLSRVQR